MTVVSLSAEQVTTALIGGAIIGASVSILLLLIGRVFGISGILGSAIVGADGGRAWRLAALLGFPVAGLVMVAAKPETMALATPQETWIYAIAGVLVGFGTQLGSGCTSGHGVCGISRMAPRSIVATLCFMAAGMVTVAILRTIGGVP
jgi:uncharacterized protein